MVHITTKMWEDWTSPEGYVDFNGSMPEYKMHLVEYHGHFAVFCESGHSRQLFATTAIKTSNSGAKAYCPTWDAVPTDFVFNFKMPDPDFSLEELEQGENIIREYQRG